jgi:tetratricopeptide (TPR) repeat protein
VKFAPDGRHAISGGDESVVYYWDVDAGKVIHKFEAPRTKINDVAFSSDGSRVAAAAINGHAYLWDLEKKTLLRKLDATWSPLRAIGFTSDGLQVLTANVITGVAVWDVETGQVMYRLGAGLPCGGLAVAPNGQWVATANIDGPVHLWALKPDVAHARDFARTGQIEKAESAYGELIRKQSSDGDLRLERARFFARLGQWEKALADYDLAIESGLPDPDVLLERGRCRGELGQWDKLAADFDAALTKLETDPNGAVRTNKICEEVLQWEPVVEKLTASRSKDAALFLAHGRHLAKRAQWAPAAAAIARSVELAPPDEIALWGQHACLRILAGDINGYRAVCTRLLSESAKPNSRFSGFVVARIATISPNAVVPDLKALETAAQKDISRWAPCQVLEQSGALAYRSGRYDQAETPLRECLVKFPQWQGQVLNWLWLAMAQHKLGQKEDALKSLAEADKWFAKFKEMPAPPPTLTAKERAAVKPADTVIPITLSDWLRAHILRREAEELIKGTVTTSKNPQ